jgi:hypothetical protein
MSEPLDLDVFAFLARLREGGFYHRVGSERADAIMVDVSTPGALWEVEFFADGQIEFERFASDGKVLGRDALAALVAKWSERPLPDGAFERANRELGLMRLLRHAGISFFLDELRIREFMIDGAIMIEAVNPGERWEIDLLPGGEIEAERFVSQFVHAFDAQAVGDLLAAFPDRSVPQRTRRGCRMSRPYR